MRLEHLHGWLGRLRHLGFIPIPIPDREGRTIQDSGGRHWQVEPWMPGLADPARPPTRERVVAGFAGLGAFHASLAQQGRVGSSAGLAARAREIEGWISGGFDALEAALRRAPAGVERERAARWSLLARRLAPVVREELGREAGRDVPLQPCLRDARPEHLLFLGNTLSGLVDFGAMALESPAADLARLLSEWIGPENALRSAALTAYGAVFPLGPDTSRLIGVFDRSTALLIGGHWARWHFLEDRSFEDPEAVRQGLGRGLDRLASLADALGH